MEGDVRAGVPGNFQRRHVDVEVRQHEALAVGETHGDLGDAFVVRTEDRDCGPRQQRGVAADMVGMVMGVEYGHQFQFFALQVVEHRLRVARINHGGVTGVADDPDVIVGKCAQRHDFVTSHIGLRSDDRPIMI